MREIEAIEDWKGQDVVDVAEQKIGKLEDVWFAPQSPDPVLLTVKSGLLGRKHHLVPLQGATVTRKHVRVAYAEDVVDAGPKADDDGLVSSSELAAVQQHYEISLGLVDGAELESGEARSARLDAAEQTAKDAQRADDDAAKAQAEAEDAAERARRAQADAATAREARTQADQNAADLHQAADDARVPQPGPADRPGIDR